jgi:hypothetical protein
MEGMEHEFVGVDDSGQEAKIIIAHQVYNIVELCATLQCHLGHAIEWPVPGYITLNSNN